MILSEYKKEREQIRRHLRRSSQYLAVKDLNRAAEECEIVLKKDKYNREAIRLREQIQRKRKVILQSERIAARDGMIADVDVFEESLFAIESRIENGHSDHLMGDGSRDIDGAIDAVAIRRRNGDAFVVVVAIFGGFTASKKIFVVQMLPALIAFILLFF